MVDSTALVLVSPEIAGSLEQGVLCITTLDCRELKGLELGTMRE